MKARFTLLLTLGALGCETPSTAPRASIPGAQFIAFRCVQNGADGTLGLPLDGCGCTELDDEGALRRLGRVECSCTVFDEMSGLQSRVEELDADCQQVSRDDRGCPVWTCTPKRDDDGDYVPLPEEGLTELGAIPDGCKPPAAPVCTPKRDSQVRAYVGSAQRGEVAVLDLTVGDETDRGRDVKRVIDIDGTIPGITAIFVDDLVTDVLAHPDGAFVFSVNSSTGTLSVIFEDGAVRERFKLDLGVGPLLEGVVWPSPSLPRDALGGPALAYVSAPNAGVVLALDLNALLDPDAVDPGRVFVQEYRLPNDEAPGRIALHPDGQTLYVAHTQAPRVTLVDTASGAAVGEIDLSLRHPCDDGYFVRVLDPDDADPTCTDGLDNDGDGVTDALDPDCNGQAGSEALDPRCPKQSQCTDGVDNDEDGAIDGDDTDCSVAADRCTDAGCVPLAAWLDWEGPVPACSDGVDNDGDGRVDRDDPGCSDEADDLEADPTERPQCSDGVDNDGDGTVDADDPDCQDTGVDPVTGQEVVRYDPLRDAELVDAPSCADPNDPRCARCENGVDDDGDGLVDAEDPGCTDADAARRYPFEGFPACADGVDGDFDGLTDYAPEGGGDPDCYAASDDNEGKSTVAVGPVDLKAVAVDFEDGVRSFLYTVDPEGSLLRADLDSDALTVSRTLTRPAVLSMAPRQFERDASLLVVGDDGVLRSLEITAPVPVTTEDGRSVFVRLRPLDQTEINRVDCAFADATDGVERPNNVDCDALLEGLSDAELDALAEFDRNSGQVVEGFYVIDDGVAWQVDAPELDGQIGELYAPGDRFTVQLDDAVVSYELPPDEADREPQSVIAEPAERPTDFDRGLRDRLVFHEGARRLVHGEVNVRTTAQGNASRVSSLPALTYDGSAARYDQNRHPTFCRLDQPESEAPDNLCVPIGLEADGEAEELADQRERTRYRVDTYEGIQVVEEDPERIVPGVYAVEYEGEIPRSESRTGQLGERTSDTEWTLLDYEVDFCRIGVEVGDVLLVDRFVAEDEEAAESAECRRFVDPEADEVDSTNLREPLRYRVAEVAQRRLRLELEPRETYEPMVTSDERTALPQLYEAPPAPPEQCAAQLTRYRVRVANGQWILTGASTGYRHPWVARDGQCEVSQRRLDAGRVGRFVLGELFSNEWFRFRLGAWQPVTCVANADCAEGLACLDSQCIDAPCAADDECPAGASCDIALELCVDDDPEPVTDEGVPPGQQPYLIDGRYEFEVVQGAAFSRLSEAAILPREMEWLPSDDRLYIVDAALQTVIEVAGLAVFDTVMQTVRTFR